MTPVPVDIAASIQRAGKSAFGPGWSAEEFVGAPGRIEVIGNHVDYNGGPVLAAAIDRRIVVGIGRGGHHHQSIRAVFADFGARDVECVDTSLPGDWRSNSPSPRPADFLRGVVAALNQRGESARGGINLVVSGDLPHGIGISSSAALCVALIHAVADRLPGDRDVVLIAQEAEHRVGSPCGTMDQSASVSGGLISFDGATGSVAARSADLTGHQFAVVNSGVVRTLATSAYPERVRETQQALALLRREWRPDLPALGAIGIGELASVVHALESAGKPGLARRVRHVVTECQRVREAEIAVSGSDWVAVGRLMAESGRSSAMDYDISHPRVEKLVSICLDQPGVLGARMMGGGQGGSALVLASVAVMGTLEARLNREYFGKMAEEPPAVRILRCRFGPGAGRMDPPQAS